MPSFAQLSPEEILADLIARPDHGSQTLLVAGPSGSGKTRWCLRLVDSARRQDLAAAGLVCPAVLTGGRKSGIQLRDVRTGEQRRLAQPLAAAPQGIGVGAWELDPAALAWGNSVLKGIRQADLLVIDELGPLEFTAGGGLESAFALIDSRSYRLACVALRPSLLPAAHTRWPWAQELLLTQHPEAA